MKQPTLHNDNTMTSTTRLYEQASLAAAKANQQRFQTAKLSAPDELHWFNNNTNWDALDRKEFREIMIRMETATVQFYNDFGDCTYPSRHVAIQAFWANEWGCEYLPESGKWRDLVTGTLIKSETEKKALKALTKAEKRALKASKKAEKASTKSENNQYNDEEEEVYKQAAQLTQSKQQSFDDRWDADEEAYEEAYAAAYALAQVQSQKEQQQQKEQKEQQQQAEQKEAQAYLDLFNYTSEEEESVDAPTTRISCQAVLYIEELTNVKGDPDWRAYIYYDARIRRYVLKGTRRSLRATSKKTVFPEVKLCFRSSGELAGYLCSSTDSRLNVTLYAMSCGALADATFAELHAQPIRGCKTELFGYDQTRPRFSTFVNYLRMVRDIDATHSTFASF